MEAVTDGEKRTLAGSERGSLAVETWGKSKEFYSTDNHHRFGVLIFLDLL